MVKCENYELQITNYEGRVTINNQLSTKKAVKAEEIFKGYETWNV